MKALESLRTTLRAVLVAALSALLFAGLVGTASAAPSTEAPGASACAGRSIPASKVSIQLWTFAEYIGFGSDAATQARHEEVLRRLSAMGYRNVEPFTLSGFTAEQYAALLRGYGLKASGRHVDVGAPESPVNITQILGGTGSSASRTSARAAPRGTTPPRRSGRHTPSTSTPSVSRPARLARR
jgi:hypothetical protein